MKYFYITTLMTLTLCQWGCGVRGDPVPPKIPAELGRGQPTYKGATEDLAFPNVPPVYAPTPEEIKKKKDSENEKK
jgi:hypothetical protein